MRRLGELEAAVMSLLWAEPETALSVREVLEQLSTRKPLAYTTVMTVLDNLHRKGFVERAKDGRAYRYRAASTREQHTAELMEAALAGTSDRAAALLHFVESISPEGLADLRAALDAFDTAPERGPS
jgi:predicted transcriptional regulator